MDLAQPLLPHSPCVRCHARQRRQSTAQALHAARQSCAGSLRQIRGIRGRPAELAQHCWLGTAAGGAALEQAGRGGRGAACG